MVVDSISLPHLATEFTPAQHAAHTTKPGVHFFEGMTAQKAASLLNKVATKGSSTGKQKAGKGRGKNRMSKANAKAITTIAKK